MTKQIIDDDLAKPLIQTGVLALLLALALVSHGGINGSIPPEPDNDAKSDEAAQKKGFIAGPGGLKMEGGGTYVTTSKNHPTEQPEP